MRNHTDADAAGTGTQTITTHTAKQKSTETNGAKKKNEKNRKMIRTFIGCGRSAGARYTHGIKPTRNRVCI
jgi:hypothetical protein